MELHYFRLSLKARSDVDLFEPRSSAGATLTREEWLRHVFAREHHFKHWNNDFVYVPETRLITDEHDLMLGWIARATTRIELTSPAEGLVPTEHTSWQASLVMVDPTVHADGQRAVMQFDVDVGQPSAVMRSLIRHVSQADVVPFDMQVYPILETGTFWAFMKDHPQIRSITFDVAVPNMFNGADDFEKELRELRDKENASNVKTTIESDTVLKLDTKRIAEIVDYTEKGAGDLSARTADGKVYNSGEHTLRIKIEIVGAPASKQSIIQQIIAFLGRIF